MSSVRIASFNIRNGLANDGPQSWSQRRHLFGPFLNSLGLDVIAFQEVYDFQLDYLLKVLPEFDSVGVGRDDGDREGEFAPIFFHRGKWNCSEAKTEWFSDTPTVPGSINWGNRLPRIATSARLTKLEDRSSFVAVSVHLDHESIESRAKSVIQLVERFSSMKPTIVMGDFNAIPSEPGLAAFNLAGWQDAGEVAQVTQGTFHGFADVEDPARIDYFWLNGEFNVRQMQVLTGETGGIFPSDHSLIFLEASFNSA